jgi:hypothetical protein
MIEGSEYPGKSKYYYNRLKEKKWNQLKKK